MSLTSVRFGEIISGAPSPGYKHPWFTTPAWLPEARRWGATVNPGFVNGQTPAYRATVPEQVAAGNPWEINPLTGKQFFSAPIFAQETTTVAIHTVDLPLYLSPAIALDFRGLGFDGDPNSSVPQFFLNLGAAAAPVQPSLDDQLDGNVPAMAPVPPANLRLLRACDLWVHQPRAGLTSTITNEPGIATGASNVTQTLSVATPAPSDALRILQGTFTPYTAATAGIDPLSNDYTEPTFDELLISTVYLLSPPNTPLGSTPDATWQPFVRHNLFWNLNWAQPEFKPVTTDPGVPFIPPLAAGAAQLLINFETASLNDMTQQALNILLAHSLAGTFWTPTGGGHDATFSADLVGRRSSPPPGPDRTVNAAAKIAALQQQQRTVQLDPDFPYNAQPFPTAFLTP